MVHTNNVYGAVQSIFALTLGAIRVNRSRRHAFVIQEIIDDIALSLRINKDNGAAWFHRKDEVKGCIALLSLGNLDSNKSLVHVCPQSKNDYTYIDQFLSDVLVRATDTTDLDAQHVILHIVTGEFAGRLWEGSGEHEISVVSISGSICFFLARPPAFRRLIYLSPGTASP